jgi:two-component system, LytTR family, sensor kinase
MKKGNTRGYYPGRRRMTIPVHIMAWTVLFLINYVFIKNYRIDFDIKYHILIWFLYLLIFYVNYSFLMPRFFFRKKLYVYAGFSILLLIGVYLIRTPLERTHFEKVIHDQQPQMHLQPVHPIPDMPPPEMKGFHKYDAGPGRPKRAPFLHFSFYSLILVFLSSITVRFIQKWQDDEKSNAEIEKERISTELSFLKQQVNPHFLFNALNSIYSMTLSTSNTAASDAILKLSSILRYMLYDTEQKKVNLADEVAVLSDYIDLQKIRLASNVEVNFHQKGDLKNHKIAPLLLLPLIENAFKHGVDNVQNCYIDIMLTMEEDDLEFLVRNRIISKNTEQKEDSGIGIRNIRRRLDLLYSGRYFFDIRKDEEVFSVLLQLNLKL